MTENRYWWLAVNGSSCAASPFPLPEEFAVSPVPEQLIGYHTRDEQMEVQALLIKAPMPEVIRYMNGMPDRIRRGDVMYRRPHNPEPPSGVTAWLMANAEQ